MIWRGVFPAITTPFNEDLSIDHDFLAKHVTWLIDNGCLGIVALGSLGEAAALSFDEKVAILRTCYKAVGHRVPIIAGVSSLTTSEAVDLAKASADAGCKGLMVLPPYVYKGDWRETHAHFTAVIRSTELSCMLYNNPIAYGTDVVPSQIKELAELPNLHAVKESSTDVRRVTGIRELLGDRLAIFVGVDDVLVEGVQAGAVGWIAGLVNAFPRESVDLYEWTISGRIDDARKLYEWFLPMLRMDTVPKFVQLIKLVQQEVGMGNERVRAPRMCVEGVERDEALAVIRQSLASNR